MRSWGNNDYFIKRATRTMQRLTFQSSKNLILGLSLVGVLCSCSGTSSSSYEPYYSQPSGSSSYTDAEPETSSYTEEESVVEDVEPYVVPYEDGELVLTQEELEVLEAIQRSQVQSYQSTQQPTYTLDQANQDLYEEQIRFEREQLDSKRYGIAQESIINNYSTFCPSTGPCN